MKVAIDAAGLARLVPLRTACIGWVGLLSDMHRRTHPCMARQVVHPPANRYRPTPVYVPPPASDGLYSRKFTLSRV